MKKRTSGDTMTTMIQLPPPLARLTLLAAALLALVATPVNAQQQAPTNGYCGTPLTTYQDGRIHKSRIVIAINEGKADAKFSRRILPGTNNSTKGMLKIEARPWPATATFAVGADGRCAGDPDPDRTWNWGSNSWVGEGRQLVSFHNAAGKVNAERLWQDSVKACTYWAIPQGEATPRFVPHTGSFTVRVYGKLCIHSKNLQNCHRFGPDGGGTIGTGLPCENANESGYNATFAPGPNCGPARWPTRELQDAYEAGDPGYKPYAEWCDFTVTAN